MLEDLPGFMAMGQGGMYEHESHAAMGHMKGPENTLPMTMGQGPFGLIGMGACSQWQRFANTPPRALIPVGIAAAISRARTSSAVLEDVVAHHELVLSEFILEEVERKLREKLGFPARDVRMLLALLRHASELVEPPELPPTACRDVKDIPIPGTAVAGKALALITGDKDLLAISAYGMIQIIGPSRFWALNSTAPKP